MMQFDAPQPERPWWLPTPEMEAERERILAGRFFLVRIGGNGHAWRCRNCGGQHRYLTLMCVEQPFSGLTRGLYAYYKTVGAYGGEGYLPPPERARYATLDGMFGSMLSMPDLASSHPQSARLVGTGERDADVGALTFTASTMSAAALGVIEPIPPSLAAAFGRRINSRGLKPPFRLEGVNLS